MATLRTDLDKAFASRRVDALADVFLETPHATLPDLLGLLKKYKIPLDAITFTRGKIDGGGHLPSPKPVAGGQTRTKEQRLVLRSLLLSVLEELTGEGQYVTALQLRSYSGAVNEYSPDQLRKALNRLIQAGSVEFAGRARGTGYRLKP